MVEHNEIQLVAMLAPDSDLSAELGVPNAEERFLGRRIFALDRATNNLVAPARLLQHRLVSRRYFFTLPRPLWNACIRELGDEAFDAETLELELALSEICGEHCWHAGLWNGRAFSYGLLRPAPAFRPPAAMANGLGWNVSQVRLDAGMRIGEERIERFRRTTRAYAGWLLTNSQFLEEHDALLQSFEGEVQAGFLEYAVVSPSTLQAFDRQPAALGNCQSAFQSFFARWRLLSLPAPYLPMPLEPQMSGIYPASILDQVQRSNGTFCIPDICQIPSRDELRNQLEDTLHGTEQPSHLRTWMRLVSGRQPDKKALRKYARQFELQHYWRILQSRHSRALHRRQGVVKRVLAEFVGVSFDTVHRDLLEIGRHRGREWDTACSPFSFGPF